MKRILIIALLLIGVATTVSAQGLQDPETDPVITARLEQWQDLKFGFMMHWGIYSQWGVV